MTLVLTEHFLWLACDSLPTLYVSCVSPRVYAGELALLYHT